MMVSISYWGSFLAGIVLLVTCLFGIRAFAPRMARAEHPAPRMLAAAIVMGFAGGALNTLYWQIWGQWALAEGWTTLPVLRFWGGFLDVPLKLSVAAAVLMHLAAWRRSLPSSERQKWSLLGMAFYPRRTGFFVRALNAFQRDDRNLNG